MDIDKSRRLFFEKRNRSDSITYRYSAKYPSKDTYTQVTSICLIQSEVTELNSRKTTKRNSELFPSCLTQEVGSVTRSQRASVLSSQTLLTIFNVEPLYLRIVAAPEH
ncbi:hypothetical protein CTM94_07755 [Photobacterium leiognathi]|uniref:Uncharacterized protein n=1 Tax=Photobacterium leiognathi TaxID=553611 RepID=A0ABX5GHK2_PHOLE|nr:hypothetical protein CTM94_07755 [Photobacterium leiognathi]